MSKLIVKTFPYVKIRLDASLLDHLLHEAAALVKSMTYEYKMDVLFKASSQSIKIPASAALWNLLVSRKAVPLINNELVDFFIIFLLFAISHNKT